MCGILEKYNIIEHIKVLKDNDWICNYIRPWDSLLLLTVKPRQENCDNIDYLFGVYVWATTLLTISSVVLNYPSYGCYIDNIENLCDSCGIILFMYLFIYLDAWSRCHKIHVRKRNDDDLVFFSSKGKNKKIKVILVAPKNMQEFYTTMI